jgi:hypothetical protein
MAEPNLNEPLIVVLERELTEQHGPMMTGEALWIALGYPSKEAFRQAFVRKTTPIPIFTLERRRGKFALTKDVAAWLALQRARAVAESSATERGSS